MLKKTQNPITAETVDPCFPLDSIQSPTVHKSNVRQKKREIRDLRRKQNAEQAMEGFNREVEFYGFTKGQFSLVDLMESTIRKTGSAELSVSTWTAAKTDVATVVDFVDSGACVSARWLVDLTFQRRTPELAKRIRDAFGADAIRVGQNHAKFFMLRNESWDVICQTSMNLNHNPRFENFSIKHDPELCDFHQAIFDEIWAKQKRTLASQRPAAIQAHFREMM